MQLFQLSARFRWIIAAHVLKSHQDTRKGRKIPGMLRRDGQLFNAFLLIAFLSAHTQYPAYRS